MNQELNKTKKFSLITIIHNSCFIILVACYLLLFTFNPSPVFAQEPNNQQQNFVNLGNIEGAGGFIPKLFGPGEFTQPTGVGGILERIFSSILGVFTLVGGLMFIIYFALGALAWISAGGKAEQIEKAKNQMTNGVIGLVILAAAYAVFYILGLVLGVDFLKPASLLQNLAPLP